MPSITGRATQLLGRLAAHASAIAGGHQQSQNAVSPGQGVQSSHRPPWARFAVPALVAAIAAALWFFAGSGPTVTVARVTKGNAAEVVYATGVVEPVLWAKVTALSRKRITDICKCEGQTVKKGDILARLDDIEEKSALAEFEARLKRIESDAERIAKLVERNITSRTTLEEKLTQIEEQKARIAAQQDRIADLTLKAPIDGIVLRRDGEVGEIAGIAAGDTLLWVGQPKPLRIVAEVNEDDILKVTHGQKVLLRHEGHVGTPLAASVDRITPKGDPQTKTFRVYLDLPDDTPLKIGMSVEANIVINEIVDGLIIPTEALGDHGVLRVRASRAILTPVEVGIRGTSSVEIRSGLEQGDRVVTPFDGKIRSGSSVTVREGSSP